MLIIHMSIYVADCPKCPNVEWLNECSNAGDCLEGVCHCDIGFEGHNCQIPRKSFICLFI